MFNLLATNEVASVINLSGWVAVCLSNSPSDHWYSCNWNACDNIIVIVIVCCCFERATSCKLGAAACLQFSHSFPPISSFAAIFLPGSSARCTHARVCAAQICTPAFCNIGLVYKCGRASFKTPNLCPSTSAAGVLQSQGIIATQSLSLGFSLHGNPNLSLGFSKSESLFLKRILFKKVTLSVQVYNCENTTEVYEDRSYECFGNFSDSGLVYTVVRRLDLPHR